MLWCKNHGEPRDSEYFPRARNQQPNSLPVKTDHVLSIRKRHLKAEANSCPILLITSVRIRDGHFHKRFS